jgi:hypothetical protein
VAGLTAAALGAVGFLAWQARGNAPTELTGGRAAAHASASPSPSAAAVREPARSAVPPDGSGTGARVVYSVRDARVWLVDADGTVRRSFPVTPGTVDPPPGSYSVTSRSNAVTGTDGTAVEHVVRFTSVGGVTIGFSAAVDGATPTADPATPAGGIRETREDGSVMWDFALIGRKVVVVR